MLSRALAVVLGILASAGPGDPLFQRYSPRDSYPVAKRNRKWKPSHHRRGRRGSNARYP